MKRVLCCLVVLVGVAEAQPVADYHYQGVVTIDPEVGDLRAQWQITVWDDTADEVRFLLRRTLSDIAVEGPAVESVAVERDADVQVLDPPITLVTVRLGAGASPRVLSMRYGGVLFADPIPDAINRITPASVELGIDSFWLPVDARLGASLTSDVVVRVGDGWEAAAPGQVVPLGRAVRLVDARPRYDVAFTMSNAFRVTEAEGFTVYNLQGHDRNVRLLTEAGTRCVASLDDALGGAGPLAEGRFVLAPRIESGYARGSYIVFTDVEDMDVAERTTFVCHELAHSWATGADFGSSDHWLNESFAEYVAMRAVREIHGEAAYRDLLAASEQRAERSGRGYVWRPDDPARPPHIVLYHEGPLALARLEYRLGAESFGAVLGAWYGQPERTTPAFLRVLGERTGPATQVWFEEVLGGEPAVTK